ncbi:MAG TPA: type II toxin-antitoxin system RelE/ParE family toxin [Thermoanaerobaculia bacterium]|jgi:plasmid stabilization system protein ParE|nr:type II toxin-antitoxin system RelE/ParE family toxin [Thermoanaerobaculia bacterium]
MASPLVFRRRVGRDLAGGYGWYEEQRVGLGEEFLGAIDESFDSIEAFPEMYAHVRGNVRRMILTRFPYAVFYQIEPKRVVVLAVLHTARDPRLWPQSRR